MNCRNLFLVMATQNPIEQEGTYPLPEAQVDRFMMKVIIGYPKKEEERAIIRQNISGETIKLSPVLKKEEILEARNIVREVYIDEKIERYIVDIVFATRLSGTSRIRFTQGNDLTSALLPVLLLTWLLQHAPMHLSNAEGM